LLTAVLVLIGLLAAYYAVHHVVEVMTMGLATLSTLKLQLTAGAAIVLISWFARNYGPMKAALNAAKKLFLRLERFVYKA
jgi:hypothetical protein